MKNIFLLVLSITIISFSNSCKDDSDDDTEKVGGCTDTLATNYNPLAEVDDASCSYEGTIAFWLSENTRQSLINSGVTSLTYYIDEVNKGSSTKFLIKAGSENCEDSYNTIILVTGNDGTFPVSYMVKDNDGSNIISGTVHIHANECTLVEIVNSL